MVKDPYQILGVSKTASQDEIRNSYRALAKKFHPDLNQGNKSAEAKFKDIASAYDLVGNADERAKFDRGETPEQKQEQNQTGRGPFYHQTQQEGGRYSFDFGRDFGGEDIFETLFRQSKNQTRGERARGGATGSEANFPGEDHLYQMEVDFRDAILGAEREITLPGGKRLRVKIPPGVESGAKLRFKGQGGPGAGTAPSGDAYVEIKVRPLAGFKRAGNDIESEIPVSFLEALTGAEVQVATLDGAVMLKIPPGVSTGTRLRIKGKGVPSGNSRGDQIAVLKVVMPKNVDPALQEAVRNWGDKFAYNPRAEA